MENIQETLIGHKNKGTLMSRENGREREKYSEGKRKEKHKDTRRRSHKPNDRWMGTHPHWHTGSDRKRVRQTTRERHTHKQTRRETRRVPQRQTRLRSDTGTDKSQITTRFSKHGHDIRKTQPRCDVNRCCTRLRSENSVRQEYSYLETRFDDTTTAHPGNPPTHLMQRSRLVGGPTAPS